MQEQRIAVAEREKEYFDRLLDARGDFNPFAPRGWQTLAARFQRWVRPRCRADLLDVGCGTGQSRQIYGEITQRYVGIDLSEQAIRTARSRYPDSEWHVADACRLPFPNNCFDVVTFSSVLHHIPHYGEALSEAFRVLRDGGYVFAFDPNLLHPAMALFRHPYSPLYSSKGVSPNECPMLPKALRRGFRRAGFQDLRQRCQSNIPYRAVEPKLINSFLTVYNLVDWIWERVGFGRWFGTFIITYGRKPLTRSSSEVAQTAPVASLPESLPRLAA